MRGYPKGCAINAQGDQITGAGCARGVEYAKNESVCPVRALSSTARVLGGALPRVPVKTDRPIPKEKLSEAMALLAGVALTAPVRLGQIALSNICGTGANWIVTRNIDKGEHL